MTKAARGQQARSPKRGPPRRVPRRAGTREATGGRQVAEADLKIVQTQVFRGPNYWSYEPCVRMLVDLGSLEEWPSNKIPGFNEGLLSLLPGVAEHSCSLGRRGGFGERLATGPGSVTSPSTWPWSSSGRPARISRAEDAKHGETGLYNVIYGYWRRPSASRPASSRSGS